MFNFNEEKISINTIENRVSISINKDSDLITSFYLIKNLIKTIEWIPESIYIIRNDSVKIKKSLNRFKNISFWEFLDIKEELDDNLTFKSEEYEWIDIIGWEIRYKLHPNNNDFIEIINRTKREKGEMLKNLKINDK